MGLLLLLLLPLPPTMSSKPRATGPAQDGEDTRHMLQPHQGPGHYRPQPNPAGQLVLPCWITATPIHGLIIWGLLFCHSYRMQCHKAWCIYSLPLGVCYLAKPWPAARFCKPVNGLCLVLDGMPLQKLCILHLSIHSWKAS